MASHYNKGCIINFPLLLLLSALLLLLLLLLPVCVWGLLYFKISGSYVLLQQLLLSLLPLVVAVARARHR